VIRWKKRVHWVIVQMTSLRKLKKNTISQRKKRFVTGSRETDEECILNVSEVRIKGRKFKSGKLERHLDKGTLQDLSDGKNRNWGGKNSNCPTENS